MMRNYSRISDKILLFFISPIISAITSLKDIRDGVSHKFLYAWFIIFGISFCAVNEAADSFRYVQRFIIESGYSLSQYLSEIKYYFTFQSHIKDIYTLTINFLVGRFTDNYHWTFFIYAIVFGYFYIKSISLFLRHNKVKNYVFYALLFIFCYSNPIFNINGVRFWTAAWIGVYVALNILVEKDYRKIPLLVLLPLIHGASIIWIPIVLLAFILKRYQIMAVIMFIASSFVSAVEYLSVLDSISHLLPQFMQDQIWSYTESEWALERLSGVTEYGAAYANFLISLPKYFNIILVYILIFNRKKINQNPNNKQLLTILLYLSALTNFIAGIPSVSRFQAFVIPFLVIVWSQNYDILRKYDNLFFMVPVIYAYSLLYWFRNMISITEIYLYIFPAPLTIVKYLLL